MPNPLSSENAPSVPETIPGWRSRFPAGLLWGGSLVALAVVYYWFRPGFESLFHLTLSLAQVLYGLISVELCIAIYLYGVGRFSPHWRLEPPARPSVRAMLFQRVPATKAGSHPLG